MRKRPFWISASFKNAARFFRKFRPCHHFRHRKSFFVSRCDDLQFTCLRINGNLRKAVCFPDRPFRIFLIFSFKNIRCPLVFRRQISAIQHPRRHSTRILRHIRIRITQITQAKRINRPNISRFNFPLNALQYFFKRRKRNIVVSTVRTRFTPMCTK